MSATLIRSSLVVLASAVCLVPAQAATHPKPPVLSGATYFGTYDRSGAETFQVKVLKQNGRKLVKVQIDAMNESQSRGTGMISKDFQTFHVKARTPGKKKFTHVFTLDGNVVGGGTSLDGTYTLKFPNGNSSTGTFSVSR
jgi:hypothetical protein